MRNGVTDAETQATEEKPGRPTLGDPVETEIAGGAPRDRLLLGTQPYVFLGPATYVEHRGERPVAFTWRLTTPMPEELFESARSAAAA